MNLKDLSTFTTSPWGFVLGLLVLLVVWEGGKKWVPALVEALVRRLRDALGGTALMRGRALRTYRERVARRYARLPVLFMPDQGLDASKVYVPLQTTDDGGDRRDDAYDRIKATDHSIVLGRPGAGKTMLLRHSMRTWASDPTWRRRQRVPVLLELHRCAGDPRSLEEHVGAQFDEDGFPKADRFVRRALRDGQLSLLFDGLDEVSSAERPRVVQLLRTFAARHPQCQIVVTCRTAIYDRQLAPEITTTFHVADFDDRHTRLFLRQWPLMADETAAERLFAALTETPRIMQLARSPLLLTMIAYLYGSRPQSQLVLPHSRAEFYREAIDILLDRLKDSRNAFQGPVKKAVLTRIALAVQHTTDASSDRRTLRYEDVLAEITAVLPKLNLSLSDAPALLTEITDRSGLLLRIDGGSRYQFAHLSVQEYLVAVAYEREQDALLARYHTAPDDWREVVKLWCGAASTDCGPLIDVVFGTDEVLAFECLADAQVVDDAVADRITSHFQRRLLADDQPDGAVVSAFGLVAADPRPRGRAVLTFLVDQSVAGQVRAFAPLAATKLPVAATTLVWLLRESGAYDAVVAMGDLAVPVLSATLAKERLLSEVRSDAVRGITPRWAAGKLVDLLADIGTPAAASVLVPLLWGPEGLGYRVAWHLAVLLARPDVEAALADAVVPGPTPSHAWVWEPFHDKERPAVTHIAARIAELVEATPEDQVPDSLPAAMDPRLAIPLLALGFGGSLQSLLKFQPGELEELQVQLALVQPDDVLTALPDGGASAQRTFDQLDAATTRHLTEVGPAARDAVASHLGAQLRIDLFARLISRDVTVQRQDWVDVRSTRVQYRFWRSAAFRVCWTLALVAVLVFGFAGFALATHWPWGYGWIGWTGMTISAVYCAVLLATASSDDNHDAMGGMHLLPIMINTTAAVGGHLATAYWLMVGAWTAVLPPLAGAPYPLVWLPVAVVLMATSWIAALRAADLVDAILMVIVVGCSATVTVVSFLVGWHYLGWPLTIVATLLAVGTPMAIHRYGTRKERRARNPLRGLLELDERTARRRTSVIAR